LAPDTLIASIAISVLATGIAQSIQGLSWRLDDVFFSPKNRKQAVGMIQPAIHRGSGIKRPGREADHSPLFNAQVRNVWGYTAIPLHAQGQLYRYLDQFVCSLLRQLVILLLP
jgi:hypothetical protein